MAYIAVFAALICAMAFVSIPVGPAGVPIVLQNAAIILAALVLGPRRGALAVLFFLLIALGLPVLAGGRTLIMAVGGPTVGYLPGYLVSAVVGGILSYRIRARGRGAQVGMMFLAALAALIVQYACGAVGMTLRAAMTPVEAILAQGIYLVPDLVKIAIASTVAVTVHTAFPRLRQGTRR